MPQPLHVVIENSACRCGDSAEGHFPLQACVCMQRDLLHSSLLRGKDSLRSFNLQRPVQISARNHILLSPQAGHTWPASRCICVNDLRHGTLPLCFTLPPLPVLGGASSPPLTAWELGSSAFLQRQLIRTGQPTM